MKVNMISTEYYLRVWLFQQKGI